MENNFGVLSKKFVLLVIFFSFHFSEDLFEGFEKAYLNLNGTKSFFF